MEQNKETNNETNKDSTKKSLSDLLKLESFMLFLVGISIFGLVIIFFYALIHPSSWSEKASTFGMFIFIAIATFLSGLLIGFIFGVPRVTESKNEGLKSGVDIGEPPA